MPLGIVSDRDFELERNNSDVSIINRQSDEPTPKIEAEVIELPKVGRIPEQVNIPTSLRSIIAEDHMENGLQSSKQLMTTLGGHISQPSINTYARGESSPGTIDVSLTNHLNGRKQKLSKKALNKLNLALTHLDENKIVGCSAVELASVAKSMAEVSSKLQPEVKEDKKDPVQFHIYAPSIKTETHYDTVVAKDNY
jgi:hypothetical protein